MKAKIIDARDAHIEGVTFSFREDLDVYKELHFENVVLGLHTEFKSGSNSRCGILEGWHHTPEWDQMESHPDTETFVYTYGTALMPFVKLDEEGNVIPGSQVIVRIPADTQVEVKAGVHHFVAVAENDKFVTLVYAPEQPGYRVKLKEKVEA